MTKDELTELNKLTLPVILIPRGNKDLWAKAEEICGLYPDFSYFIIDEENK